MDDHLHENKGGDSNLEFYWKNTPSIHVHGMEDMEDMEVAMVS